MIMKNYSIKTTLSREHLKDCLECQERRQLLIDQSVVFGAFIPVTPPRALAERILEKTANPILGQRLKNRI